MAKHLIDWYLERLEGVEGSHGQWASWCPCHDDVGTSHKGLSISVVGSKILMKCHSPHCGATLIAVTEELEKREGMVTEIEDVVVNVRSHKSRNGSQVGGKEALPMKKEKAKGGMAWWCDRTGVPKEVWDGLGCIEYENGVAFTFEDMGGIWKWRKPPKEMGWVGTEGPNAPPLWPVPPDECDEHAYITEGESDAGTLVAVGLGQTFAVTKGAKTSLSPNLFEALMRRGVREVTICPDADESGDEFSRECSESAVTAGLAVNVLHLARVLDPFSGINDLNGIYKECGSPEIFREILQRSTERVAERFPVLTLEELDVMAEEEMDWMLHELLAPDDKVLIIGPQKSYKTWVGLDLARSLVSGSKFLNRDEWVVDQRRRVLFIEEEGSVGKWARRVRRLQLNGNARGYFHTLHRKAIRFTESGTIDFVISYCKEHAIEVIIFDPLQRMIPGINENDSSETAVIWDEIARIQRAIPGIACVVIHHANKTEGMTNWESGRGSSRHAGEADLGLFLNRHPTEDSTVRIAVDGRDIPQYLGTGESFEAKVQISKDDETPYLMIDATEVSVKVNPVRAMAAKNKDSTLNAIADGCSTFASIVSVTAASENTVRKHLSSLVKEGTVIETDNGKGKAKTYAAREESEE